MSHRKYLNKYGEALYILHFPGTGMEGHEYIINENLDRKIILSSDLSIISIMNKKCWNNSILKKQCDYNNIHLYNTALNESNWNNTLKIGHILKSLEEVNTKYCLILDGRDVSIVNDLDDSFIEKYNTLGKPIIYNGTPVAFPEKVIESLQDLLSIKGKQKYLNAGVCIGTKESLLDFYSKAEEINNQFPENDSEQFIIRKTSKLYPEIVGHDEENRIFRIIHQYDTSIKECGDDLLII